MTAPQLRSARIFARVFPKVKSNALYNTKHALLRWFDDLGAALTNDLQDALQHVSQDIGADQLLSWYTDCVRAHFVQRYAVLGLSLSVATLPDTFATLYRAYAHYSTPIPQNNALQHAFKALCTGAVPTTTLEPLLEEWLRDNLQSNARPEFLKTITAIRACGFGRVLDGVFGRMLGAAVKEAVHETFAGQWDKATREPAQEYVLRRFGDVTALILHASSSTGKLLTSYTVDVLRNLRTTELFDIITAYPTSQPALEDLRHILTVPEHRAHLTSTFSAAVSKRLLHPGADTGLILTHFVHTVRAFQIIDPRGVLLDKVARPIRAYLSGREDMVHCITLGLFGAVTSDIDGPNLAGELERSAKEAEVEDEWGLDWLPDPNDALPTYRSGRGKDVVGMLLGLSESKDPFVKEMQVLLAGRLLRDEVLKTWACEDEVRTVELLKGRFGEGTLNQLEIMLRDIQESKVIDSTIKKGGDGNGLSAVILSRLFWPTLKKETLRLPAEVEEKFEAYEQGFTKLKASRQLAWHKTLGVVNVNLDFEDGRRVDIDATPAQAVVVHAFGEESELSVKDLKARTDMDDAGVKRALAFWVKNKVLRATSDNTYAPLEDASTASTTTAPSFLPTDAEPASAIQSAADAAAEEMRIYWQFIVGMLTNLGPMPIERMQMMLGMLVPGGFTRSLEELRSFLEVMAKEGKIELGTGGVYKLV
ncbi:hypothetical protein SAICODRAFT_97971 [Saitoella complicata NRRL Y-17804]|uniref:Anaphase-promoting complex subunit 2 n=1 Tax=Saitoella complicata (strain BCRC 22490 / CBS 7301 / JCM 7358 / NBRC 10748 / NRRL Y-17804) TaxID=698492 RepID=A0A0E9NJ70_SAICN|nr:uncharacterized protein SAICODRAFT_97971 [Saitoella complicata NRRL Y-17804]ODQ50062.1 hypothetical protein SAICODRAFT_97971 [Saitoella complicata NRRL Y-17804]GAO49751.1 hypothetical protein G7K_3893-t1 [Saitoella complicata NRRL Y-17804]